METRLASEVIECKYVFSPPQEGFLLSWLDRSLVRDPRFPSGTVSSIYYDTSDLKFYHESRYGYYRRTKARLRWYDEVEKASPDDLITSYLEIKRKRGRLRRKERGAIRVEAYKLADDPFTDVTILGFGRRFQKAAPQPGQIFVPVALIQYQRRRFFDPGTGSRVSLDTRIEGTRRNPAYLPSLVGSTTVSAGVLEIKGHSDVLPDTLRPIVPLLIGDSFSKYGRCCEQLLHPMRTALS